MTKTKLPIALFVVALIIAIPALLRAVGSDDAAASPLLTPAASDSGVRPAAERVALWESRIVPGSDDYLNHTALGAALVDLAQQSGDEAYFGEAEQALVTALDNNPRWLPAKGLLAAVQLSSHDFTGALSLAEEVWEADDEQYTALGVLGDAAVELGLYDQAKDAYMTLLDEADGPAVRVRLASLYFHLYGPSEARAHAEVALEQANAQGLDATQLAVYAVQAATYRFESADISGAAELADAALDVAPDYGPALALEARISAAQGDLERAAELYALANADGTSPDYAIALGDVFSAMGDDAAAEAQYLAAGALYDELAESALESNVRDIALYEADLGGNHDLAVELAMSELDVRKDIFSYDTAVWVLLQADRPDEAARVAEDLAAFGSTDPHVLYHLGMVAAATGDDETARHYLTQLLDETPAFDLGAAPDAQAALDALP